MNKNIENIKDQLRTLSEPGTTIEISNAESDLLDIRNVYDELEESEVING